MVLVGSVSSNSIVHLTPRGSSYDIHNSAIETIEERSMSMTSMSQVEPEQLDKVEEQTLEKNSVSSPSIQLRTIAQASNLQKQATNPQTIKSHNSTVSKKTGETKTGTAHQKVRGVAT